MSITECGDKVDAVLGGVACSCGYQLQTGKVYAQTQAGEHDRWGHKVFLYFFDKDRLLPADSVQIAGRLGIENLRGIESVSSKE